MAGDQSRGSAQAPALKVMCRIPISLGHVEQRYGLAGQRVRTVLEEVSHPIVDVGVATETRKVLVVRMLAIVVTPAAIAGLWIPGEMSGGNQQGGFERRRRDAAVPRPAAGSFAGGVAQDHGQGDAPLRAGHVDFEVGRLARVASDDLAIDDLDRAGLHALFHSSIVISFMRELAVSFSIRSGIPS